MHIRENQPAVMAVMDVSLGDGLPHIADGVGDMINRRKIRFRIRLLKAHNRLDFHIVMPLERPHRSLAPRRENRQPMSLLAQMKRDLF